MCWELVRHRHFVFEIPACCISYGVDFGMKHVRLGTRWLMGHWLRYGLFGHQVLSIVNGEETWFHFFVLILFAALLLQMMFMTV